MLVMTPGFLFLQKYINILIATTKKPFFFTFLLSPSPSNIFPKIIASFRRKEYLLGLEKVSFRVLESNFSIVATRLGSSAEPSQQVCRLQSAPLSSLVGIPCCRTTITLLVVQNAIKLPKDCSNRCLYLKFMAHVPLF